MAETFFIKRHDTDPPIVVLLTRKDNTGADIPVDVTNASAIQFIMRDVFLNSVVTGPCTVIGFPQAGQVQYQWQQGDTNTAGSFPAEVQVTFSDGNIITCPNTEYIVIQIMEDLN